MTDWKNFLGGSSQYEPDAVGSYVEIFGRVGLHDRHGLKMSVERITKSASAQLAPEFTVAWDFTAVPINLSYEFLLSGPESSTTPFFGAGMGFYHSDVHSSGISTGELSSTHGERDGWGFGFHAYFGQRATITQSLAMSVLLRGRVADGMWFTDDKKDIDVDFTGVDCILGLEWLF